MNALVIAAGDAAMPNPPTSEQVAKLAAELTVDAHFKEIAKLAAELEAAKRARREAEALLGEAALQKLRTQQKVDALLRETSQNVDRTKVANDGSREEEG
jgi:outer membrane PBP1 activator LpoA protein